MTETLTRPRARTKQHDLRRHVLALVLFLVLVWHTVVSPSYTAAPLGATDTEPPDAEERELEARAAAGFAGIAPAATPPADEFGQSAEELDWPEIIGDD